MTHSDSSTRSWLRRLQAGDSLAAQRLWEKFYHRLVHLARRNLHRRYRGMVDSEDVALSAFHCFCHGVERGRYPQLLDPNDLWRLLVTITLRKIVHVMRDQDRIKRGGGLRAAADWGDADDEQAAIDGLVGREPTPEFAAQVAEQCECLMQRLGNDELVQLALERRDERS
jgi:DNA-directed RNA polymerase specialized sigma24 family protein